MKDEVKAFKHEQHSFHPSSFILHPFLIQIPLALASGVIDVDDLQLRVETQRGRALLAVADARALDAAEGDMRLAAGGRRVDVRHARLDLVNETKDARSVVGEDGRREAVFGIVGDHHRLLEIPDAQHGQHWAEDFFARDTHVGRDVIEHGGAHEVALVQAIAGGTLAAASQLRAVLAPNLYVTQDGLKLALVTAWPTLRLRVIARPDSHALRARDDAPDEFVGDLVDDDRS